MPREQTGPAPQDQTPRFLVPGKSVRLSGATARVPIPGQEPAPAAPPSAAEPKVELVRAGDVIQAIEVTCACGRRIRLLCHYQ